MKCGAVTTAAFLWLASCHGSFAWEHRSSTSALDDSQTLHAWTDIDTHDNVELHLQCFSNQNVSVWITTDEPYDHSADYTPIDVQFRVDGGAVMSARFHGRNFNNQLIWTSDSWESVREEAESIMMFYQFRSASDEIALGVLNSVYVANIGNAVPRDAVQRACSM